jgi:hypothetical protein
VTSHPQQRPHNTGDKLRSSIACAGFVCFIPLFGGAAIATQSHHASGDRRLGNRNTSLFCADHRERGEHLGPLSAPRTGQCHATGTSDMEALQVQMGAPQPRQSYPPVLRAPPLDPRPAPAAACPRRRHRPYRAFRLQPTPPNPLLQAPAALRGLRRD